MEETSSHVRGGGTSKPFERNTDSGSRLHQEGERQNDEDTRSNRGLDEGETRRLSRTDEQLDSNNQENGDQGIRGSLENEIDEEREADEASFFDGRKDYWIVEFNENLN